MKQIKKDTTNFKAWDYEVEFNRATYVKRGEISVCDDVAFRTMVDAANCFGYDLAPKAMWTAGIKHPHEDNTLIWFPKLYPNDLWDNSISDDDAIIYEKAVDGNKAEQHMHSVLSKGERRRIVFARVKSPLEDVLYRFKGVYTLNESRTQDEGKVVWERESEKVRTYGQL